MISLLLTRTNCDDVNVYLYHYSKHILDFASKKNIKWKDLKNNENNRDVLSSSIKKLKPRLIVFNGHGDKNTIWGHKENILIKEGDNEDLLKNKIVYARSCNAAISLGRSAIKEGTEAFIGYDGPFALCTIPYKECSPGEDEVAKLFLNPSNLIITSLLKGNNVEEANEKSINLMKKEILKLQSQSGIEGSQHIIPFLKWNMLVQIPLGNLNAQII